jgi:hypothetical protein
VPEKVPEEVESALFIPFFQNRSCQKKITDMMESFVFSLSVEGLCMRNKNIRLEWSTIQFGKICGDLRKIQQDFFFFSRFSEIIDHMGGVEIELRQDEAEVINQQTGSTLAEGRQWLDGFQALTYSRIRSLDIDGDFSRTNRQRKVISTLIEKFRNTKLTTLMGLLDDVLPMITTDLSNSEILDLAKDLFPMLADCTIVSQRVPADGSYYLAMINQQSCIVADMDAARELLAQTMGD